MPKGDPIKDVTAIEWSKESRKLFIPKFLNNLDQQTLRDVKRTLMRLDAEVSYYLDIRNEQGRGGKK
jgi:hypothetical protein